MTTDQSALTTADELGAFVPDTRRTIRGAAEGPLHGLAFAVKDLFDVAGMRTGAGCREYLDEAPVASAHAPAVAALLAEGPDFVGKTITDQLAFSLSGTNASYGMPKNPAAPGRVPGGSSSGSAVAVAAGVVDLALGTDTGGSVRVPASYCGIFGLRPTHGYITLDGVVPLAPSFDTVGLFAGRAGHLASAWGALSTRAGSGERVTGRTLGASALTELIVAPELLALLDADAVDAFQLAAETTAAGLGCDLVSRPVFDDGLAAMLERFRAVQFAEAWRSHGAFIERCRPALGPGVAARFASAKDADPRDAGAIGPDRDAARRQLERALGASALLLQPASSGVAPPPSLVGAEKDALRTRTLALTAPAGVAGAPVLVLPGARVGALPFGVALCGLPGEDSLLLECAVALDSAGPDVAGSGAHR